MRAVFIYDVYERPTMQDDKKPVVFSIQVISAKQDDAMEQKIQALEDIFSELDQDKYYQVLFTYCSVERINSHINEIFVGNINYLRNNFDLINMDLSLINAAMTGICLKEGDLSSDEIVNLKRIDRPASSCCDNVF